MGQRRSADKRQCEGPQLAASHPTLEGPAPPRQAGAREPADPLRRLSSAAGAGQLNRKESGEPRPDRALRDR